MVSPKYPMLRLEIPFAEYGLSLQKTLALSHGALKRRLAASGKLFLLGYRKTE